MRAIVLFYLSCFLAFVCGHMVNYAVIIYAQDVLGSDLLSGIGFGLCFGPPLILGWYAGVLCDRLAPGRIIVFSQLVFVVAAALLYGADAWIPIPLDRIFMLVTAAFLAGCGWSFIAPARLAALPQIVAPERLHGSMVFLNLLIMLGFGIAPMVIAVVHQNGGWSAVFVFIGLGFVLASLLLAWVPSEGSDKIRKHALDEVREGLRAVVAKPILLQLLLISVLAYTLMGPMQVLLPRLASSELMLTGLERGAYLGTLALALIIGGILCMALKSRLPDGWVILLGCLAAGAGIASLSQIEHPWASAAMLLASGIVGGMVVSLIVAGLQAEATPAVRGRVMSMYTITSQIVPAASGLLAGALSEFLGVVTAMLICGLLIALAALFGIGHLRLVRAYVHA